MKHLKDIKNKIAWEKYHDPDFNWNDRSFYENNNLAEDFIREFYTQINWNYLSYFQKNLSEDILNDFMSYWNWYYLLKNIKVSEKLLRVFAFVQKLKDNNLWGLISVTQKLSENFIRDHQKYVVWHEVSRYQKLSESFIEEFSCEVDWYNISRYQKLSEDFIERNIHKMRPQDIVRYQKLSDEFIVKHFKNYFNCDVYGIIKYQKLNEDTIKSLIKLFQYDYEWLTLIQKQTLSETFLVKHRKKIGWENILLFQNISPETIKKYKREIPNKYLEGTKYDIQSIQRKNCKNH